MNKKQIQVIYSSGTFGNCLRWLLDRFSTDSKFKNIDSPWDKNNRAHDWDGQRFLKKFTLAHQLVDDCLGGPIPDADKIVINWPLKDLLFAMRMDFIRNPRMEKEDTRYEHIIKKANASFVKKTFGDVKINKQVAKELTKIKIHDIKNHSWWTKMFEFMNDESHHQFPLEAMWDKENLTKQLQIISDKFNLDLVIEEKVINNVVAKINTMHVITTRNRADKVLQAIEKKEDLDCGDLDIIEQAYIETILEQKNDCIIFPYGTTWFANTKEINSFIETYPSYLKHMNPTLPWYKGYKNPYYLKDKID